MKKNISLIVMLIFFLKISGQENTIYIEYRLKISDEEGLFVDNDFLRQAFLKAVNNEKKLSFGLLINMYGSKFYFNAESSLDSGNSMTQALGTYSGVVYDLDKSIFKQSSLLGDNVYCKTELKDNWVLYNETKMIDDFLCYKATNVKRVEGLDRIFNHPVTAWYCPALPYRYGPNGYGNLPGLILELQVRNVNYASKIIQLKSELRFDTEFLKKAKILTTEELEKKLMEFNNFEGK